MPSLWARADGSESFGRSNLTRYSPEGRDSITSAEYSPLIPNFLDFAVFPPGLSKHRQVLCGELEGRRRRHSTLPPLCLCPGRRAFNTDTSFRNMDKLDGRISGSSWKKW